METQIMEIQKENIGALTFPNQDVITALEAIKERQKNLHAATSLGNLEKHKVHIYFEDAEGMKMVNTTIWALTEKNIMLKGGQSIPIHRIHRVETV
jgi:hypothetical protein